MPPECCAPGPDQGGHDPALRILWLVPYGLWPAHNGGRLRAAALISGVAGSGAEVTVLYADDDRAVPETIPGVVWRPFEPRRRTRATQKLRSFLSRYPEYAWLPQSVEAGRWIRDNSASFDVVIMEQTHMASFARWIKDIPSLIVDTQNVEHDVLSQIAASMPRARSRFRFRVDAIKCRHMEQRLLARADLVMACSTDDATALHSLSGGREVSVQPNGVDTVEFGYQVPDDRRGNVVVMTGTLGYLPNLDAARWIHAEIWPEIRRQVPDAEFHLVGAQCPPELERLHSPETGFRVVGQVDDVRTSLYAARAFLMPLRMGGGTRLKALQAMSAGCPIVSTARGVEGLGVSAGMAMLSEDAAGLARGTVSLLRDESLRTATAALARDHVTAHYSWSAIIEDFAAQVRLVVIRAGAAS